MSQNYLILFKQTNDLFYLQNITDRNIQVKLMECHGNNDDEMMDWLTDLFACNPSLVNSATKPIEIKNATLIITG